MTPPSGNPNIEEYEASVVGATPEKKCSVKASAAKKECELTGLISNTPYTISMRACMPRSAGCGAVVSKATRTRPYRMSNAFNRACYFLKWAKYFFAFVPQ